MAATDLDRLEEAFRGSRTLAIRCDLVAPAGTAVHVEINGWGRRKKPSIKGGIITRRGKGRSATESWALLYELNDGQDYAALRDVFTRVAAAYPGAKPKPGSVVVTVGDGPLSRNRIRPLVYGAWYEAYGLPAPSPAKLASPKQKASPKAGVQARAKLQPAADWAAILRTGPDGVKKWNRLTRTGRKAVNLSGADLGGCDLAGINLSDAKADKASFASSNLTGARLTDGGFDGADFTGARLTGADLSAARFRKSSFAGADLTGANLAQASLQGADLTGAALAGAVLDKAWFDKNTKWPAGFVIPGEMTFFGSGTDPRLSGKGKKAVATDINGLMARLNALIDPKRMKRTLDMLKAGKNQLFAEIEPTLVRGIVRSQTEEDLVYSCVLTQDGVYACCTPDLQPCLGLRGEPCKHLLVLLIGLARAGQLDATTIDKWVMAAAGKNHKWNKTTQNHVSDTLLKYKGVQAGEIDWRPTETIPEDFYAM